MSIRIVSKVVRLAAFIASGPLAASSGSKPSLRNAAAQNLRFVGWSSTTRFAGETRRPCKRQVAAPAYPLVAASARVRIAGPSRVLQQGRRLDRFHQEPRKRVAPLHPGDLRSADIERAEQDQRH